MKYVAFLRAIMPQVNPNHRMEKLKAVFEELGFSQVKTFLASGNVIFESDSSNQPELEAKIEAALKAKTGGEVPTIIRSQQELDHLIKANPFKGVEENNNEKPHVTFFKSPPDKSKLPTSGKGFKGYGFESGAYCYTVDMVAVKTPEAMLTLEKLFGKQITTRTWNTVNRVYKLLESL